MAAISTYFIVLAAKSLKLIAAGFISRFIAGELNATATHCVLLIGSISAEFVVAAGIILEAPKDKTFREKFGMVLVLGGVVLGSLFTVAIFVFDEGISNSQQSKLETEDKETNRLFLIGLHEEILAAGFELDSAQANEEAERERLARTKLEAQIAPRRVSKELSQAIASLVARYRVKSVWVGSYTPDAESSVLCEQIASPIGASNLAASNACARLIPAVKIAVGIRIGGANSAFERALAKALNDAKLLAEIDTDTVGVKGNGPEDVRVLVGVKPFAVSDADAAKQQTTSP